MTFKESLKILGIEKYAKRIIRSNSHGELFHLYQYVIIAEELGETEWFSRWFEDVVKEVETKWKRPESVFQHIGDLLAKQMEYETT